MEVKYHNHNGYYNDGNSHYWSIDQILDLRGKTLSTKREDTYYMQFAKNGIFEEKIETTQQPLFEFTINQENIIFETLKPLIETAKKYPHLNTFKFFSQKHKYFIMGRINKAIKI